MEDHSGEAAILKSVRLFTDFQPLEKEEIAKFTEAELHVYQKRLKIFRDWYAVLKTKFDEGKMEGKIEGKLEGLTLVAQKMKANGMAIALIAEMTGLRIQDIEAL